MNSFAEVDRIKAVKSELRVDSPKFSYRFPALTVTLFRWKVGK